MDHQPDFMLPCHLKSALKCWQCSDLIGCLLGCRSVACPFEDCYGFVERFSRCINFACGPVIFGAISMAFS
ncbi:hypothetical protein [Eubacterium callanderi]|uniref:hypothetical protein n=1 Tax=Eubacterium callanderi TaxID=53442 RepID=UPI0034A59F45